MLVTPGAWANHDGLRINPFYTNPINSSGQGTASFGPQLREALDHETAERDGEHWRPYVFSGGLHAASSTLTSSAFATVAYVPERVSQTSTAITYAAVANDVCWTIISSDNNGITGWTRVGSGSTGAYYYQCEGDSTPNEPALPANSTWLLRATVTESALVTVTDLRRTNQLPFTNVHFLDPAIGGRCDGRTDDRTAFTAAIANLSGRGGGVLMLPQGTCTTTSTSTLLTVNVDNITVVGSGVLSTILENLGTGDVVAITPAACAAGSGNSRDRVRFSGMAIRGNNASTGGYGINSCNATNLMLEHINVSRTGNHTIFLNAANGPYNARLHHVTFTPSSSAGAAVRGLQVGAYNGLLLDSVYANCGGSRDVCIDTTGTAGITVVGGNIDGATVGIRGAGPVFISGLWVDVTSPAPVAIITPFQPTANNAWVAVGVVGPSSASNAFDFTNINPIYVTWIGQSAGYLSGTLRIDEQNPLQITVDQNAYNPSGLCLNNSVIRVSTDAERAINGIVGGSAGNCPTGSIITFVNVGSFNLVFNHDNGGASATNRIAMPSSRAYVLSPQYAVSLRRDGTNNGLGQAGWRLLDSGTVCLESEAALDFPNTAAQSSSDLTTTVTGAETADPIFLGPAPTPASAANGTFTAFVSATNTVTVRFSNYSTGAIDPASGTFRMRVCKQRS